jgi:cytochrome P450
MNIATPLSGGQCPITHDFDPFSASYLANPYPLYNRLRQESPVIYSPEYNLYLVTRFDLSVQIMKDRETFSSSNAQIPFTPIQPDAAAILASGFPRKPTFSNCDAPRHPKMRNAASRCLRPRRWTVVQPFVHDYLTELLDKKLQQPVLDICQDVIFPMTAFAGFRLLGFPLTDTDMLRSWSGKRVLLTYGRLTADEQVEAAHNLVDFWSYCRDFVRARLKDPGDDLTTDLLALSKERGDDLTVEDVDNMVYSMALAAHETSASGISNGMIRLMDQRQHWDAACADPAIIPNLAEELMRFDAPVVTMRRLAKVNTTLGGVPIPAGATIMMLLGASNHDPEQFPNPEQINPRRANADEHLAFGNGLHYCLGAPLARFEYNLFLTEITRRAPRMQAAAQDVPYSPAILIRGPERFLVEPRL